jgi:outer membrane protein TolC
MYPIKTLRAPLAATLLIILTGCTVHPQGESQERLAAKQQGAPYVKPFEHRPPTTLPANPTPDDLVRVALLNNADLEQKYWDWRSAIEQITQDGTEPTNLTFSFGDMITNGSTSLNQSTVSAGNDPMADIVLPRKLSVAAQRSLADAKAAGVRFQKARYELRAKVLGAYDDYALSAELARLEDANAALLQSTAAQTEALNRAGAGAQQDVLKAQNELDMSRNDAAAMKAQLVTQRAALNALLSRDADAAIAVPAALPATRAMTLSDGQLLQLAAAGNPELAALADEIRSKDKGIELARLQYLPDLSANVGTDLRGVTQTLAGSLTVPFLRYEAINAAVAQAEANLRSTQAMRRQTLNDLNAQVVLDIVSLRDSDRQLELFDRTLLPRARQVVALSRTTYEAGRGALLDLLDSERSLIDIERLTANLRVTREKNLVDLEAVTGQELSPAVSPNDAVTSAR